RETETCHVAAHPAQVIVHAEPARGHAELHAIDPDPEIAGKRQIGGPAVDTTVEGADRRYPQVLKLVDPAFAQVRTGHAGRHLRRLCPERAQIVARAEHRAGSGQDQHAHIPLALDGGKQLTENVDIRALDPVAMPRSIEPDGGAILTYIEYGRARNGGFR